MNIVIDLLQREIESYENNSTNLTRNDLIILGLYRRNLILLQSIDFSNMDYLSGSIEEIENRYEGKKFIPVEEELYNKYIKASKFYNIAKEAISELEEKE